MAVITKDIDFSKPLTEEQNKMLDALKDRPITFDDDLPEFTAEQLRSMKRVTNRKRKDA